MNNLLKRSKCFREDETEIICSCLGISRSVVQLVERWSPKPNVVGSNPTPSANARYRANINYVF